jgi:hypothetical protein
MLKALAVLRTVFLLFIAGYTIRAMPVFSTVATTFDEQYARCSATLNQLMRAAWLAIAWIALETLVGWILARRSARALPAPAAAAPVPPAAPPPRT